MLSAAVPDQTLAGQDAPSLIAPLTQPAEVPGLTETGPASKAGLTRQPDEGQRSAEGKPAAPSQPDEGSHPAQVAAAVEQAGPGGQAPAQATEFDKICASILQRAEAENARQAEAAAQMVADAASQAMSAAVKGLTVMVTSLADSVVTSLQAAAAVRMDHAQAEVRAVCEAAQVGTCFWWLHICHSVAVLQTASFGACCICVHYAAWPRAGPAAHSDVV